MSVSGDWIAVAHNIENLQVRYDAGEDDNMMDAPAANPSEDPLTWINRVAITITGHAAQRLDRWRLRLRRYLRAEDPVEPSLLAEHYQRSL